MAGGFVAQERDSGLNYLADLQATIREIWRRACEHDGIDPSCSFAVFSPDNPIVPFYNRALAIYREDFASYRSLGYIGMRMAGRAELYKRRGRKKQKT